MPGFLKRNVLPIAHVMENDPPLPCTHCRELKPYALYAIGADVAYGDPHAHLVLALYPFVDEDLDWRPGHANAAKGIPVHLWRWIPLVEANLPEGTLIRFFPAGFLAEHQDQQARYVVVGSKTDQNLVFSDLHVVDR
jgi:hypothetical protein